MDINKEKIVFVTTNKHKFQEVKDILRDYPIELERASLEYEENHDQGIEEIARTAAKKLANELKKPVVVEDTGLFFEAYHNFPGALPKFVINSLGFKGIFKLLKGESRKAYFKTAAAFCGPGGRPVLFEGIMKGKITKKVYNINKDAMLYDKVFIPEGQTKTISSLTMGEKNSLSQRAEAFRKFGEYIAEKTKSQRIN